MFFSVVFYALTKVRLGEVKVLEKGFSGRQTKYKNVPFRIPKHLLFSFRVLYINQYDIDSCDFVVKTEFVAIKYNITTI